MAGSGKERDQAQVITMPLPTQFHRQREQFIYARAPQLVYWEATRILSVGLRPLPGGGDPQRSPFSKVIQITPPGASASGWQSSAAHCQQPLVITGGDPLRAPTYLRNRLCTRSLGLSVSTTPAGTRALTAEVIDQFHATRACAVSPSAWTAPRRRLARLPSVGSLAR